VTLVLGNQVQIWLARCFTSGDVFDFISLTTFQPKFFRDLWTFIVGTGLTPRRMETDVDINSKRWYAKAARMPVRVIRVFTNCSPGRWLIVNDINRG
jgi:hypothetical protein